MKLVTVAEMQAIEQEANAGGLTYEIMMENAGRALAEVVMDEYGFLEESSALGLIGSGNNGGDTLVALAHLAQEGWKTGAYFVRPRPKNDALVSRLLEAGGQVYTFATSPDLELLGRLIDEYSLILDGVLGTGMRLPLKAEITQVLAYARQKLAGMDDPSVVVAVDCPSGMDCDSGEAAPECLPAGLTVTMAAVKQGLFKFPAYSLVGELRVVGIGLPGEGEGLAAWRAINCMVPDADWVRNVLPARPPDAHKGTFGSVLAVAGSINYTGAALLAGQAAYRIGAGLVTLAVPSPLHESLSGHFPEATWLLLPHEIGVIAADAADVVIKNLERISAMLVGPGFGLEDSTGEFMERLLAGASRPGAGRIGFVASAKAETGKARPKLPPLVVDADGLKLLARIHDWPTILPAPAVLTPHPGEMSVLTGLSIDEIQAARLETARNYSHKWGHVLVLKGAFSVIAAPDGRLAVIPVASAALARAGSGDVLAGLIAGLRAQGVEAFQAATAGAWIHAYAGLQAAQVIGNTASVLAGDILRSVPDVLSELG